MATLGKTGFGTVGCYCCVNYYGVTKRCYGLLCNENLAAYRTVATLGKTGFGTVGCYCCVNYYGVTKRCFFVCNVAVATYRTSIIGVTSLGTSRCCYFCIIAVAKRCFFVIGIFISATRTNVGGVTILGTSGCCYASFMVVTKCCFKLSTTYGTYASLGTVCVFTEIMSGSINLVCNVSVTTYGTGVSSVTVFGTGGRCYYCVIAVTLSCYLVCNVSVTTYGTGVSSVTVFGTGGCCYFCIIAVTLSCYLVCNVAVATSTSVSGVTSLGTGGCCYASLIVVTKRCFKLSATYGTGLSVGTGCACAGSVPLSCYLVCLVAVTTTRTGVSGVTSLGASRCCHYCIVLVTKCCYLVCLVAVTTNTGISGVTSLSASRCCYYCIVLVSKRCIKLYATYGTDLISSTGCACACSVTLSCNFVCLVAVTTNTGISGVTSLSASRCCYYCIVLMVTILNPYTVGICICAGKCIIVIAKLQGCDIDCNVCRLVGKLLSLIRYSLTTLVTKHNNSAFFCYKASIISDIINGIASQMIAVGIVNRTCRCIYSTSDDNLCVLFRSVPSLFIRKRTAGNVRKRSYVSMACISAIIYV